MTETDPQKNPIVKATLNAVCAALQRRDYLTTEWRTSVVAAGLSALMAITDIRGPVAVQVTAVLAPVLIAAVYAAVRTMHKSALATLLVADLFPANADSQTDTGGLC